MDGEVSRAVDGEGNDLGDVLGGDGHLAVELLGVLLGLLMGNVPGQFGRDGAWLNYGNADIGQEALGAATPTTR